MENKKTALDWLINEIWGIDEPPLGIKLYYVTAKQMEKEQIVEAHLQGLYSAIKMKGERQSEEYYEQNFGH